MRKSFMYGAVIIVLLFSSQTIWAFGNKEATDNAAQPLRVAMELQYPPFEMVGEDGKPAGVSIDIVHALGEYLNRPVEIYNTSWIGLIPALQTNKVDMVLSSMTITAERQKIVDFSDPYAHSGLSMLIFHKSPVTNIEDFLNPQNNPKLNGKIIRLGVRSGTIAADFVNKYNIDQNPRVEVLIIDTPATQILELVQGKIDAVLSDPITAQQVALQNKDTIWVNFAPIEPPGLWGVAVKKGNTVLREQINAFLAEFRMRGGFDALTNKYFVDLQQMFVEQNIPFFFDIDE